MPSPTPIPQLNYYKGETLSFDPDLAAMELPASVLESYEGSELLTGAYWADVTTDELFGIVTLKWRDTESVFDFCRRARSEERHAKKPLPTAEEDDSDDLVFISCIPWFEYTQVTQEMSMDRDDSVPRLMWGRAVERDGARQLPFTAQVNHRLIDGIHIYKLKCAIEREFQALLGGNDGKKD